MEKIAKHGIFLISLDFELHWGVRDKRSTKEYSNNLLGARAVIPELLELFQQYNIHVTWATVGFLFYDNFEDLNLSIARKIPVYNKPILNPYLEFDSLGKNEKEDPYHYALSLIQLIKSNPNQEIASHTFSHYYCLEDGQDIECFEADLIAAIEAGKKNGITIESLVFPRNQHNKKYLDIVKKHGIISFRGNPKSWIYNERKEEDNSVLLKVFRFLDAYVNLSGKNCYFVSEINPDPPYNIPASRFLYPHISALKLFDSLKLKRIFSEMKYAATHNMVYHIWWHPHNFGINREENLQMLTQILEYFKALHEDYGMESMNMQELSSNILRDSK